MQQNKFLGFCKVKAPVIGLLKTGALTLRALLKYEERNN